MCTSDLYTRELVADRLREAERERLVRAAASPRDPRPRLAAVLAAITRFRRTRADRRGHAARPT